MTIFDNTTLNAAALPENYFFGRGLDLFASDSLGMNRTLMEAADYAAAHPTGRCQWHFGRQRVMLITHPDDIGLITGKYYKHLKSQDATNTFNLIFGQSIFSVSTESRYWRDARTQFLNMFHTKTALHNSFTPMKNAIDRYITQLQETGDTTSASKLMTKLTIDIIAETQLNITGISSDAKERIAENINKITAILARPWSQMIGRYLPFSSWTPFKYCFMKDLTRLLEDSYQILEEHFLAQHKDANDLPEQGSWFAFSERTAPGNRQALRSILAQLIVAGHETTSKFLFFALMTLGDPNKHDIVLKLRSEIDSYIDFKTTPEMRAQGKQYTPDLWDEDDFNELNYLNAFSLEVLRLYTPIPDMFFEVEKPIPFASGLEKGDLLAILPRITHKLEAAFGPNAAIFDPSRFLEVSLSDVIDKKNSRFIGFGFDQRKCIGKRFALQEEKIIVAKIVYGFDVEVTHIVDHRTDYQEIITMHLSKAAEEARIRLIPRTEHSLSEELTAPTVSTLRHRNVV